MRIMPDELKRNEAGQVLRKDGTIDGRSTRTGKPGANRNISGLRPITETMRDREAERKANKEALLTRAGMLEFIRNIAADPSEKNKKISMAAVEILLELDKHAEQEEKVPVSVRAWIDDVYERRLKIEMAAKATGGS
jgi:hypothetical protein